jgi:hypothetical protein
MFRKRLRHHLPHNCALRTRSGGLSRDLPGCSAAKRLGVRIAIRDPSYGPERVFAMNHRVLKSLLPFGLSCVLSLSAPAPLARAQNIPAHITLLVMEGEGATSGVRQRVARDPVVKVEDDDHRPVAGASVVFALPVSGASGEFVNGSRNLTVLTGEDGLATARGLRMNDVPGRLQLYVTASYRGLRARTLISQFVEAVPGWKPKDPELRASKSGGRWKWIVLGVAAAGGAGAGIYFGRQTTAATPVSISAGTVVFGSPH